jgi:CHAT domain-containing protein/Flp pilus assembly protein TadD
VVALGDNQFSLKARQEALKKLAQAVPALLKAGETVEAARTLNQMGGLQLRLQETDAALISYQKALSLLKRGPVPEVIVDSLNGLGDGYLQLNQLRQAEKILKRALLMSERWNYARGKAQALLKLSERQNFDNQKVALQTAFEGLRVWQSLDDKPGLARAYSHIGRCYLAQNLLLEATQNYQQALDRWSDLKDTGEQAEALIMMGMIEFRRADWTRTIELVTQAQKMLEEDGEPERLGQIAAVLAEAFNENGSWESGITHYKRALEYYREAKKPHNVFYATWGLGVSYYLAGNYPEALTHFQDALTSPELSDLEAAQVRQYLGRVYTATGKYPDAMLNLRSALAVYTQSVNFKEQAQVRALMGIVYQQQGDLASARQNYHEALKVFRRLSDLLNESAVNFELGRLELRSGNYDAAEDYLKRSIEGTEHIRRTSASSDLTAAFSAWVHERYENYIECLMRKHGAEPARGFAISAFETSESARGRSLAELLRATQTNLTSGLDAELAEREKSVRQLLRVKEDYKITLLGKADSKAELAQLETGIAALEGQYAEVTQTIRSRYPSYEQVTQPTGWSLKKIQEQVVSDDQTLLLEYSLGEHKSYAWAVSRTGITSYELPPQAQIETAVQTVHELLATPPRAGALDELTPAIWKLAQMVLSPMAAELDKPTVIVVADGALAYIPFQILPLPASENEPLIARFEVINAPSASILGQLREETSHRQPVAKTLAALGDPVFASNYEMAKDSANRKQLPGTEAGKNQPSERALRAIKVRPDSDDPADLQPLFYAKRELANLQEVAGDSESLVMSGFDATHEALLSTELKRYAILHIATHGLLDPRQPEQSRLIFSTVDRNGKPQDGRVGLQDIYGLRAPVDLVVLSACQTALGKEVRGEGLMGLTRGFMYAGASSVVASLWKVDDEATAELMKQFYINMLQKKMPRAAALRAAQNNVRQRAEWHAPYYWAAFTLQGEYRKVISRPARATRPVSAVMVGLSSILLIGLGSWYYVQRRRQRRLGM